MPFPYTDLSSVKKRPAIVIAELKGDDIILAQITSVKRNDENLVNLSKDDFEIGCLDHNSFVIASMIFTADSSTVCYKVGKLKQEKILEIQNKLCELFTN